MSEEEKKYGTEDEVAVEGKDTEKEDSEKNEAGVKGTESTESAEASGTAEGHEENTEKPWKNADNARYAEMRRQNEELKRRIARLESENRESVTDEALKDLGFRREDLEDSENMEVAKAYIRALAKGAENPKATAYEQVYRSKREAQKQAEAEKERLSKQEADEKALVDRDIAEFRKTYPDVNIADVTKDGSEFMKSFGGVVTNGNVTKFYGIYLSLKGNGAPKKVDEATKNRSNPTIVGSSAGTSAGEITQSEILSLPKDKFDEAMAKIRSGKLKLKH